MNIPDNEQHEREISVVRHLLKICNERISGYKKASLEIRDDELKELFLQFAMQTEGFTKQLLEFIKERRALHMETRTISEIWEAWMELRSSLTKGDSISILDVCLTGEKAAVGQFKAALDKDISQQLKHIIRAQLEQIEDAYHNIRHLKHTI